MDGWDYDEYLNSEVKKIKELKSKGFTVKDILDLNEFSYEALRICDLPLTYLIPRSESQEMTLQEWNTHTSSEYKWEFLNGMPFGQRDERDRILLGLLYSAGLKHLLDILPTSSKEEMKKLLQIE